jgi:hypothetical protein
MEKPEGQKSLLSLRRKWKHNITMDLKEIEWSGVNWTDLNQDTDN